MDVIDKIKKAFNKVPEADPVIEGSPEAYDVVQAMSDDELKKRYMGKEPIHVPREGQEELYKRWVAPHANSSCSKCYGRGFEYWMPELHQLRPCDCIHRAIRKATEKEVQRDYLYDAHGDKININKKEDKDNG